MSFHSKSLQSPLVKKTADTRPTTPPLMRVSGKATGPIPAKAPALPAFRFADIAITASRGEAPPTRPLMLQAKRMVGAVHDPAEREADAVADQQGGGRRLGADLSRVRVHTSAHADDLSRFIQAAALTTGHDIFFRQGVYSPASRGGQETLAHTLTHVVQPDKKDHQVQRTALRGNHMDPSGSWNATLDGSGRAVKVEADNLKLNPNAIIPGGGTNAPSVDPQGWNWLNQNHLSHPGGPPNYVRMHLLNGRLGGPGNDEDNLAPGSGSLNSHHSKNFEDEAQGWLAQGGEIQKYTVEVTYNGPSNHLTTVSGKQHWQDTVKEVEGEFEFVHYSGKKRKLSLANFAAEEDAGLDKTGNWTNH